MSGGVIEIKDQRAKVKNAESIRDALIKKTRAEKSGNNRKMGFWGEISENGVVGDTDNSVIIGLWHY